MCKFLYLFLDETRIEYTCTNPGGFGFTLYDKNGNEIYTLSPRYTCASVVTVLGRIETILV